MIDESARLRDLMESMPTRPPRLDITQVVGDGRRAVRRSRYTTASVVAALVVLTLAGVYAGLGHLRAGPNTAQPAPTSGSPTGPVLPCTIEPLTVLGSDYFEVYGDPTGHYVVTGGGKSIVLWADGHTTVVGNGDRAVAHAVNAHGVVVGDYADDRSWVYDGTRLQTLPRLAGYAYTSAWAINSSGDIVGIASNSGTWEPRVAVIWPAAQPGTARELAVPPNPYGAEAVAIGDDGTVVGNIGTMEYNSINYDHAFVWDASGHGHLLADPPNTMGGTATAISGDWVAGHVSPGGPYDPSSWRAVRWNLRTGEVTVPYPDTVSSAVAVTSSGAVLLSVGSPPSLVLFGRGAPLGRLPGLIDPGTWQVGGISRNGKVIVGKPNGQAVIWRC